MYTPPRSSLIETSRFMAFGGEAGVHKNSTVHEFTIAKFTFQDQLDILKYSFNRQFCFVSLHCLKRKGKMSEILAQLIRATICGYN